MYGDFQSPSIGSTGGQDTFASGPHNGNDFIYDFSGSLGQGDIIEISGFKGGHTLESFADLNITQEDADNNCTTDSVIHFDNNDSVTVYNVAGLTADDFMFV